MSDQVRILLISAVALDAEAIEHELKQEAISSSLRRVESRDAFLDVLHSFCPDIILSEYHLPQFDALSALPFVKEVSPDTPFILVTDPLDDETFVECIKSGVFDYVSKTHLVGLAPAVRRALVLSREKKEKTQIQKDLSGMISAFDQKIAERTRELRQTNAALERAVHLKDEFLAGMNHEIRTPLNVILGMSEMLFDRVYGDLNLKQTKTVQAIEESGRHLLSLINDILDLSKIEAGKVELKMTDVNIESACQSSLVFVRQAAMKKRLKLSSMFDCNVAWVRADERRLKQMLVNLLTNAVKFTPAGGSVGLRVEGDPDGRTVRFIVWDTGTGIEKPQISKLFKPFVQLDNRLSRKTGTGLGLALVHQMVKMHGGEIRVESEPNKGSRFILSLPWQQEEQVAFPLNTSNASPPSGDTLVSTTAHPSMDIVIAPTTPPLILLAEDRDDNIDTLCGYLTAKGYRLKIARNGTEAVELSCHESPDLILMDIQMPEMDGLEAIRRIRARLDTHEVPIVAVTALVMPGDREKCLAAGADEYVSKPLRLRELSRLISQLLASPSGNP